MDELIQRVDTWACSVPLPAPIDFGSFQVRVRHYVAVRVTERSGRFAESIGHTRGSPVDLAILDVIAPALMRKSARDIPARYADFRAATLALERDGVMGRAWSLLEIALNGLMAAAQNVPVWRLLGGSERSLEVMLIEGYPMAQESDRDFTDRLIGRVEAGYAAIKIAAGNYKPDELLRRLRELRRRAPQVKLVLDMAWSWRSAESNSELLGALEDIGVDWVEDAFERDAIQEYRTARGLSKVPIGCGDEVSRAADLLALVDAEALDVVRLDATALGGVSAVVPLAASLTRRGVRISFHDHPEVHQQCALAGDCVSHVEVFPIDRSFDARARLCRNTVHARVVRGQLPPTYVPGNGIELDDEQLTRWSVRHGHVAR